MRHASTPAEHEVFPGFHGRFVHSAAMTFAWWTIDEGAEVPEHEHPHEQVVNVLEGELALTVDGTEQSCTPATSWRSPAACGTRRARSALPRPRRLQPGARGLPVASRPPTATAPGAGRAARAARLHDSEPMTKRRPLCRRVRRESRRRQHPREASWPPRRGNPACLDRRHARAIEPGDHHLRSTRRQRPRTRSPRSPIAADDEIALEQPRRRQRSARAPGLARSPERRRPETGASGAHYRTAPPCRISAATAALISPSASAGEHQPRMDQLPGALAGAAGDDYRRTHMRDGEQELREGHRQPHAAVTCRIAGQVAGVQRHPVPGQPVNVRHRGVVVGRRMVVLVLLQDDEDPGRRRVPRLAARAGRDRDPHPVAVDVHQLLGQRHDHRDRPLRRALGMPGNSPGRSPASSKTTSSPRSPRGTMSAPSVAAKASGAASPPR